VSRDLVRYMVAVDDHRSCLERPCLGDLQTANLLECADVCPVISVSGE